MKEEIKQLIKNHYAGEAAFTVERPKDLTHGDYASNVAIVAKLSAEDLAAKLNQDKPKWLEQVTVAHLGGLAGPGFINFYLSANFYTAELGKILDQGEHYGREQLNQGQKVIIEYTDPNPFKEFHIGHLMSNAVGETLSRLIEFSGAEVKRACYQGDVGLHVAKAVWGLRALKISNPTIADLGRAYAHGAAEGREEEIREINKKIYDRSDLAINALYDQGRQISLDYFETIYQKLGTRFDFKFFESAAGPFGQKLVEEGLRKGIFERSDGAVIFRGDEKAGLHTRVFINSEGLPTYEAKELGLAKIKYDAYPYDQSVVVSGNEINAYFKVLLKAMSLIFPDLAAKTKHVSHGMLRLPSGKMSSRTGQVITAESLIAEVEERALAKMKDSDLSAADQTRVAEMVAVGAIKYSILKQSPGKDIIFDLEKSLSFEGDSGPYLQYTLVRAEAVLAKVGNITFGSFPLPSEISLPERLLTRFPEVVDRAGRELAPNLLVSYLIDLAAAFNAFYAKNRIIGSEEESHRLALTAAAAQVLKNGLWLLGIKPPARM